MGVSCLFVRLVIFLVSLRLQEKSGHGKMVLVAVEAVPAGSKPPAAVRVRISAGKNTALAPQCRCLSGRIPCTKKSQRSGGVVTEAGHISGRDRPGSQNSYPRASLELLLYHPYACESSCLPSINMLKAC